MKSASVRFSFFAKYSDMRLVVKVCMGVFSLLSDRQVDIGYDPYCIFET